MWPQAKKCLSKADDRLATQYRQPASQRPVAQASAPVPAAPEQRWTSACALPTANTVHQECPKRAIPRRVPGRQLVHKELGANNQWQDGGAASRDKAGNPDH